MLLNPQNYNEKKGSTSKIHQIIKRYRSKENQKHIMANKLNVLKKEYLTNLNKSKLIDSKTEKVRQIKDEYHKTKIFIAMYLKREKSIEEEKLNMKKRNRELQMTEMGKVKRTLQTQRSRIYLQSKEKKKIIGQTIYRNWLNNLNEKRQKSQQVRLSEQKSKLNRTIYLQKKKQTAQMQSSSDMSYLQEFTRQNQRQIQQMKELQSQIVSQLNSSRITLKKSKQSSKPCKYALSKILRA